MYLEPNNPSLSFANFLDAAIRDKAEISQMCDKVAGSSPKGSRKGAMVKGWCFLPLKTRKALDLQGLLCWGAKLLPQYGSPCWT